jgi:hypothetical protein
MLGHYRQFVRYRLFLSKNLVRGSYDALLTASDPMLDNPANVWQ